MSATDLNADERKRKELREENRRLRIRKRSLETRIQALIDDMKEPPTTWEETLKEENAHLRIQNRTLMKKMRILSEKRSQGGFLGGDA